VWDAGFAMADTDPSNFIHHAPIADPDLAAVDAFWRAACFLGAGQLYLTTNALLKESLSADQVKPRLLGHWGTQPGLNLIYAHLTRLIRDQGDETLLVVGPGHGAPGILACEFLDGSLASTYADLKTDIIGANQLVHRFSWPGGAPSHLTPDTPGSLHEGGELGYSLGHAFGAALDDPELLVVCVVGDGEAETGPLAASWQGPKFLNPATDGAVLPILHLNGYKLSGPTLLARMGDDELVDYFTGLRYETRIVAGDEPAAVHRQMWDALEWANGRRKEIQGEARRHGADGVPAWPLIALRTPKGWGCPRELDGRPVEGTFHAHQIPISDPRGDPGHLAVLDTWLRSYRPDELFDDLGAPSEQVLSICPRGHLRLGQSQRANGGTRLKDLDQPDWRDYCVHVPAPGQVEGEATKAAARYLRDVFVRNEEERNFRLFCPDETSSNRLDAVYEVTSRAWMDPLVDTDEHLSRDGRVMEILSEHMCEGWFEGYVLTGRHGLFPCYEAFMPIAESMVHQHGKWIEQCQPLHWRKPVSSLNFLLTSHCWRQDHNGFSHQGPGFLGSLLNLRRTVSRVYLPPDANCLLSVLDHCLGSRDYVNLIISSKQPQLQYLTMEEAGAHCRRGASVWEWASTETGDDVDVVLASAGDVPTHETVAAAALLRRHVPDIRVKVSNVVDLFTLKSHRDHTHGFDEVSFRELFTDDRPVVFAFHGYPRVIHELIYDRPDPGRFHVHGYDEQGTTTTPFDMTVVNNMSRYQLAMAALRRIPRLASVVGDVADHFEAKLSEHRYHIENHGEDLDEITNWRWPLPGAAR
jgi:xylulose-5-phosphate/fructose-6-phosphate phosphoketolase